MIDKNMDKFEEIFRSYDDIDDLEALLEFLCEFESWAEDDARGLSYKARAEAYNIVDTMRGAVIGVLEDLKKEE